MSDLWPAQGNRAQALGLPSCASNRLESDLLGLVGRAAPGRRAGGSTHPLHL